MDALKKWFESISQREQKLVIAGAIMAFIAIFYFALWSPLHNAVDTQKLALAKEKLTLTWVKEQGSRAQILRQSSNKTTYNGSLTQLVNQTTRSANIPVSRIQPQGEELQITIDEVAFNKLMTWLESLEKRGVMVIQSDMSEVDAQGFVQVRRLQLGKA